MIRKVMKVFLPLLLAVSHPSVAHPMKIITEEYPPLSYISEGKLTGSSVEIVREILRRMNQPDKIEILPWARAYNLLKAEPNVVLFSTTLTKERQNLFHWIGPLCIAKNGFYKKKGSPLEINSIEDAKKVEAIATYKEDAREQMLMSWGFNNLDSSKSAVSNIRKLISGRVDLWLYDNIGMPGVAEKAGIDPKDIDLVLSIDEVSLYIAISQKTDIEIVRKWRNTLQEMKNDGTFYLISKNWLPESSIPNGRTYVRNNLEKFPLKIYSEDSPPGNYLLNGKPAGIAVEIVREILTRQDKKIEIEVVPWARGYRIALGRPNVALFSTTRLPQRENLFKWVGPLYVQKWGFYAKRETDLEINSLDDAKEVGSIGTYLDDAKGQFLKNEGFENLIIAKKNSSNIKHLLEGTIDLWISSDFNMPYLVRQIGANPQKLKLVMSIRTVANYIAFSRGTPDSEIASWQQTLDEIKSDGTYDQLKRKALTDWQKQFSTVETQMN